MPDRLGAMEARAPERWTEVTVETDSALSDERFDLVEETSRALQEVADLDAVLAVALESVVPSLASLAVLVLEQNPGAPRVEVAHARPEEEPRLRREVTASSRRHPSAPLATTPSKVTLLPLDPDRHRQFLPGQRHRWPREGPAAVVRRRLSHRGRAPGERQDDRRDRARPDRSRASLSMPPTTPRRRCWDTASRWRWNRRCCGRTSRPRSTGGRSWARPCTSGSGCSTAAWWGAAVVDGHRPPDRHGQSRLRPAAWIRRPREPGGAAVLGAAAPERAREPEEWRSGRKGKVYETVHRRFDGTTLPVLVSVTPLDNQEESRLLRGDGAGPHRPQAYRGAASAGPADGSRRPVGRRRGARSEQHDDDHPGLQRSARAGSGRHG